MNTKPTYKELEKKIAVLEKKIVELEGSKNGHSKKRRKIERS